MWPWACITALTMARRCGVIRSPRARSSSITSMSCPVPRCGILAATCRCNDRCMCVPRLTARWWQAESRAAHGSAVRACAELKGSHVRDTGDLRLGGVRAEVAGEERGERARVVSLGGSSPARALLRRAGSGARRRRRSRIADERQVPVHEPHAALAQAEVVAAHVAVQQRVARERRVCGGVVQGLDRPRSHASRAQAEPEESLGVPPISGQPLKSNWPCRPLRMSGGGGVAPPGAGRRARHRRSRCPTGRPVSGRQVLERDDRAVPVVVPADEPGEERHTARVRVEEMFVAEPRGGLHGVPDLHEGARAVGEPGHPPRRDRHPAALAGRPGHRRHTDRVRDPIDVAGSGPSIRGAYPPPPSGTPACG